jgi:putative acetyltransferase
VSQPDEETVALPSFRKSLFSRVVGPIRIRPFDEADIPAIREVVFTVLEEFGFELELNGMDGDLEDPESAYRGGGGDLWVVEDGGGGIVGTCGVWPDPADPRRCELRKMYLLAGLRGRGVGRKLLDTALDHARREGFTRMELETAEAMDEARRLYRGVGFEEIESSTPSSRCRIRFAIDLEAR